jgi:hypothetical protein
MADTALVVIDMINPPSRLFVLRLPRVGSVTPAPGAMLGARRKQRGARCQRSWRRRRLPSGAWERSSEWERRLL